MLEDFGWSGDEFFLGDCREDWDVRADNWQDEQDSLEDDDWGYDDEEDDFLDDERGDYYDDCPMDGDFDSGMASCGWGTDEDYGYYGEW